MKEMIKKFVLRTIECNFDTHFVYIDVDVDDSERNERWSVKGEFELDLNEGIVYPVKMEMSIWHTSDDTFIDASFNDDASYCISQYDEDLEKTLVLTKLYDIEARERIFSEVNERLKFIFNMYFPYGSTCHC